MNDAERVTDVEAATGLVLTLKVAVVAPAGIVTEPGTLATVGSLLDKEMTAPPLGAGPPNVTVPVDELPPLTLAGLTLSDERPALPVMKTLPPAYQTTRV